MEQIKLEEESNIIDENKTEKLQVDSNSSLKNSLTHFEDLSNELIYEIFDCLNFCHVYEAFFNLNIRFENLLTNSAYPIKIDLSYISNSTFQRYHTNIIIPYQHRIQSLRFSNPLIIDYVLSSVSVVLNFTRLESLIISTIHPQYLHELLDHLQWLPNLCSLVIMPGCIRTSNRCEFYKQIFRLPVLKYCKLSVEKSSTTTILPFATNEFSPIEHLVIEDESDFMQLNTVLSYVPQLRHLSCRSCDNYDEEDVLYQYALNYLIHVSLNDIRTTFDKFELLIKNLFYQVEVLYISIQNHAETYIDANRWKRLILSHMPHLRIFDIRLSHCASFEYATSVEFIALFDQFNSSFWIERQWFFEYQTYKKTLDIDFPEYFDFYSINPYRRKKYIFRDETLKERCPHPFIHKINSVHDVVMDNRKGMYDSMYFFPNADQLTLYTYADENQTSLMTRFYRIISFKKLTKLVLYCNNVSQIIELLQYTPDIHTLTISYESFENMEIESRNNKTFQLVSKTNNIKKMLILSECTLRRIEYFLRLCPRLQHLAIEKPRSQYQTEDIVRFLLSKDNFDAGHLSSLRIRTAYLPIISKLRGLLAFLLDDVLWHIKHGRRFIDDADLYLWCVSITFIDHCCIFTQLDVLLSYTPEICYLDFQHEPDPDSNIEIIFQTPLSNLKHVSMDLTYLFYDEFEIFI